MSSSSPIPLQTRFSWRRPLTSYAKVQHWIGNVVRNRRFQLKRARAKQPRYLDVGCGPNTHSHFINIDYLWRPNIDVCWDITRGLPFEDGTVRGIFIEHCLEHFSLPVALDLLREFRRVLEPGGVVRIVVPDGELYLKTYLAQNEGSITSRFPFQDIESFDGLYTPMLSVNRVFYFDRHSPFGHRFIYDAQTLCLLLRKAGFDWAEKTAYRQGRDPVLQIDTGSRKCESLYVEAGVA